jgi:CBS domain-containing protein
MDTVEDLLHAKGAEVFSVEPDQSVFEALEVMAAREIGAVVVSSAGRIEGILSERDYARQVILKGKASRDTRISEIMSTDLVTVEPGRSIEECMALMTDRRIRHLPVVSGEEMIGLISIGDVVKALLSEREHRIEQLETYITQG